MPTTADLLLGLALPMLVAAAIAALTKVHRARSSTQGQADAEIRQRSDRWSQFWIASALALGYTVGHVGLQGIPSILPDEASGWLVHLVAVAWLVGIASHCLHRPGRSADQNHAINPLWILLPAGFFVSLIAAWAMLQSFAPESWADAPPLEDDFFSFDTESTDQWSARQFLGVIAMLAVAGSAAWGWLGRSIRSDSNSSHPPTGEASRPWAWWVVIFGTAGVIQLTGSASLAMLGGSFAAALGGTIIGAWGRWHVFRPAGPIVAATVGGLLVVAYFYSSLPLLWAWFMFTALLPAGGLFATLWRRSLRQTRRAAALDLLLTFLVVGWVLAAAVRKFIADAGDALL